MPRPGQRVHRLPSRLDYTLIPAPLDLSLPLVTEKSPLPAIIVTPSSPSSSHDFSIAFLASTPKPTLIERVSLLVPSKSLSLPVKVRTTVVILLIIFVLVCHAVTHTLAVRRPHLEFSVQTGEGHIVDTTINWFDFRSLIGNNASEPEDTPALAGWSVHSIS
ncbi:hypothetical protein E4T56_gene18287 [Termitomyces sp. T112]|nr:hypothetical protein E4T56_gene18287 [Termitomyces sp. T112]